MKKQFIFRDNVLVQIRSHYWDRKIHPIFNKTTFPNIYGQIKGFELTCTHITLYIGWQ